MNRNLQNKELTTEELTAIALDNGLVTKEKLQGFITMTHNPNLIRSHLVHLTAETRFSMWSRGELILNTNPKE